MKEIELKLEIHNNSSQVKSKIESSGAEYRGKYIQTDFWLDTRDKQLKSKGIGLRVRKQNGEATLTLKQGQVSAEMREAEEVEVRVDNFENIFEILKRLGFGVEAEIKKEREVWGLGSVIICLDSVESLGTFLELEGPAEKIEEAIRKLGLETLPRITKHYGQLFEQKAINKSQEK